jgi:FkbM family methyltransferase
MNIRPRRLKGATELLTHALGPRLNSTLGRLGFQLTRTGESNLTSMRAALARSARRGPPVGTIIDVGASDGRWSEVARQSFPAASILLIEANETHRAGLESFRGRIPVSDFVIAAAGENVGRLYFDGSDPFGGLASSHATETSSSIPATTIDHEVASRSLTGPYLIKLDTHGFEVPILAGARNTLRQTELLILEVYNFTLCQGSLRFYEMCAHLAELGFRPIDLCDPMYRPADGVLWQCDMFFARSDRAEFRHNTYATP